MGVFGINFWWEGKGERKGGEGGRRKGERIFKGEDWEG